MKHQPSQNEQPLWLPSAIGTSYTPLGHPTPEHRATSLPSFWVVITTDSWVLTIILVGYTIEFCSIHQRPLFILIPPSSALQMKFYWILKNPSLGDHIPPSGTISYSLRHFIICTLAQLCCPVFFPALFFWVSRATALIPESPLDCYLCIPSPHWWLDNLFSPCHILSLGHDLLASTF